MEDHFEDVDDGIDCLFKDNCISKGIKCTRCKNNKRGFVPPKHPNIWGTE